MKPDRTVESVLAGRVRELRAARGMSQKQLGEMVGLDRADVSRLERNVARPSVQCVRIDRVVALAHALGVRLPDLLPGF